MKVYNEVIPNPDEDCVRHGVDFVNRVKPDILIAVGGGSVIDCAKVIAHWLGIPYITVPTSASHDGIASPAISYLLRKKLSECIGGDYSILDPPIAIVADIDVISRAPYRLLAAGCGDLIAKLTAEQEEPGSLKEEIKRKRRRLWAKKCQLEKLEYS